MFEMNLVLLEAEVQDIVNVLGQLPTQSGAFTLYQKVALQLDEVKKKREIQEE